MPCQLCLVTRTMALVPRLKRSWGRVSAEYQDQSCVILSHAGLGQQLRLEMTLHSLQSASGFLLHIRGNVNAFLVCRIAMLYFHDPGLAKSLLFPTSPIMLQPPLSDCCSPNTVSTYPLLPQALCICSSRIKLFTQILDG